MNDLTIESKLRNPEKVKEMFEKIPMENFVMYASQLLFKCANCGQCCERCVNITFDTEDCSIAANYLGIGRNKFMIDYTLTHPSSSKYRVTNATPDGPCIFRGIENKKCKIYPARGKICRVYPMMNIDQNQYKPHIYFECEGASNFVNEIIAYQKEHEEECKAFVDNQQKENDPTFEFLMRVLFVKSLEIIHGSKYAEIAATTLGIKWDAIQENMDNIKEDLKIFVAGVVPIGSLEKLREDWENEPKNNEKYRHGELESEGIGNNL